MSAPFTKARVGRTGSYPGYFIVHILPYLETSISKRAEEASRFIESAIREKLEREAKA